MSKKCVVNRNEDGIITSIEVKNLSYSNENNNTDYSVDNINNDKYNYAVSSNNGNDLDIAPNGKPSLLYKSYIDLGYSEIEAKNLVSEIYTKEFKDWFGYWQNDPENASKVVDENGQPKMVWSGNTSSIIEKNINNSVFQGYRIYGNEYNNFEKDEDNPENYRFSNTALFVEDKKLATTYATGMNAFRTPANIINKYAPKDSFLEPVFLNIRNYEKVDEVSNKIIPIITSSIEKGIDGFYGGNRGEYSEYKTWAIRDADQARSAKHVPFQTEENVLVGAVINTLKNKGLVSDVKLLSNDEMTSKLVELGVPESVITNKDQEALNTELSERGLKSIVGGFYKKDTRQIFLNKDSNNLLNTTIHEFSHPMIEWLIENRRDLFNSGIDLLKNNKDEIVNYIKRVDTLYPNIKKDSDAYWEEVMAEIIANNGVDLINKEKKSIIKEWLDRIWETFKSMVGITGYTAEEVSNMTVKEFANAVNAEMFNEVSLDTLLRVGRNIGYEFDTELTARERFNISKLKRISAGSDRIVYELDDNKVIKIAKTARGLMQNIYEGSYDLVEEELLPDIYERGLNYVIVEKVSPIKARDIVPTYDVEGDQIGTEKAEKMFADFSKFSQIDFDSQSQKLIDTLYKYGMFYIVNREVLFGDFSRKANWGIKNGKPIHLDGGTFAGTRLLSEYKGKNNLEDEDFKEAYNRSKSFKKIIGDRDRNTMFSLIDNNDLDYSANSPLVKNLKDVDGNAIQLQKSNERLTPITKQAFDALVKKLQKAFPGFAKVTYDFEAFKKQAEKLGATFNDIQRMVMAFHGSPHSFLKEILVENELGQREYLVGSSDSFPEVPKGYKVIKEFPFGRFRLDKMGTGEGLQVFGWGLYFTDLKGIAENYANMNQIKRIIFPKNITQYFHSFQPTDSLLYINAFLNQISEVIYENKFDKNKTIDYYKELISEFENKESAMAKIDVKDYQTIISILNETTILPSSANLYNVSLHQGKTPEQYTWLEWDSNFNIQDIPIIHSIFELSKFRENMLNSGNDMPYEEYETLREEYSKKYNDVKNKYEISSDDLTKLVDELFYKTDIKKNSNLYFRIGDILNSYEEASLFLLKNGIDGVKYPAESLSRGATSDNARGFNYVVFDENAITIEDKIQFMQTPNGTIYGAKLPDGTIYLNSEFLNANTPIHEFSHLFEQLLPSRFKSGIELLKQTDLGKKLFEQLKQEGNYANLTDEQLWGEALNTHIGNFGENEVNNPKGKLKQLQDWIRDFFTKVGDVLGIKKLSPDTQLRMFTEGVVKDLLGGKPIVAENQVSPSEQVQYSFLTENDYDANGNIKPEVLAEIQAEREAIKAEAQANGTFMKAPNGKATNLNEAQWIDVRTKRFADFFGDIFGNYKKIDTHLDDIMNSLKITRRC